MNFLHFVFIASFAARFLQCFADDGECKNADGSYCLNNGEIVVPNYVGNDQCMALPGHTQMHANSLAFFLQNHQFCGGGPKGTDGLLICYTGQLDPQGEMLARGVRHSILYQLENAPGNKVAAKCRDLVGKDWHGILLNTNDQGDWVIRLSITNYIFVIKREDAPEWLFFKLASAKDGGESFLSKSFGPLRDFMHWGKRQSGKAEEAKNRIRQEINAKLLGLFMQNVGKGAKLRDFPGLWTIGLDMLPFHEDTHQIVLFVNRSECCADIQAWFNVPTGEQPIPNVKKVEQKDGIDMEGSLVENFGGILDGVVDRDAKMLVFEMTDLFHPKGKAQGMRLKVNFEDNSMVFEHKLDDQWTAPELAKPLQNHFRRGAPFHLVFILRKKELVINMNCYGEVKLPAGADIVFENTQRIKISGGYKLVKSFRMGGHGVKFIVGKSWPIAEGKGMSAENSSGIMIEGKIDEKANSFSIKLWNKDMEGDGLYNCILEMEVGIAIQEIKIFNGISDGEQPVEKVESSYDAGQSFEAFFQFNDNGTIGVWMDNMLLISKNKNPKVLSVVHYVQIVGGAFGNMMNIPKTPFKCVLEKSSKDGVNITAKVLPFFDEVEKRGFEIRLQNTAAGGSTPLQLIASFIANDISTIMLFEKIGRDAKASKKLDANLLKAGEYFDLKIGYHPSNASEMVVNINGMDYVFGSENKFAQTDEYEIEGAIIIRELSPAACKQ